MKTLQQAYQEFNYDHYLAEQLVGTSQAVNAYVECCGRYLGLNKTALIWEGKMANLHSGHLNSWQTLLENWPTTLLRVA